MSDAIRFDPALIARHDRPGPRYTSYPTAAEFRDDFHAADFAAAAVARRATHIDVPLSVYIHVPFCTSPCFYCACTRVITRRPEAGEEYLQRLEREIALQAALLGPRPIEQLHFGGGTPTFLTASQLTRVIDTLARHFRMLPVPPRREYSIEVDPRTVDPDTIASLAELGFNRLSLGVQDFDPHVQRAVNRVQSTSDTLELIGAARRNGFDSVSVDLIYGLPLQTVQSFGATLDLVAMARPDRVAAYSYAHLPRQFKAQRQIDDTELPRGEEKLALLTLVVDKLTAAGYEYIGLDHFALPDDELAVARRTGGLQRNFQGYSTRGGLDLVGLGMSAIGHTGDVFAQNTRELDLYYRAIDHGSLAVARGMRLTPDDRVRADVIAGLMCQGEVDVAAIESRHHLRFAEHFGAELRELERLAEDALVEMDARAIRITPRGQFLLRAVARVFDAYLPASSPATPRYSRVV